MQKMFNLAVVLMMLFFFLTPQSGSAQSKDQIKKDTKTAAALTKVGAWECSKLQKDGREIRVKEIAGTVTMNFSTRKEKKNEKYTDAKGNEKTKKVTEVTNVFKMEMGGNDRIFNYNVKNDSIQFVGLNGWNDYRIVRAEKDEVVLEHDLDNSLFRWTMIPMPKDTSKKK